MNGGAGWGPGEDEPRKPGEQSGHRGAGRGLKREGQVDELVDDYPEAWGGVAGGLLSSSAVRLRGSGQVAIKCVSCRRISVNVTEHRAQELRGRPRGARPATRVFFALIARRRRQARSPPAPDGWPELRCRPQSVRPARGSGGAFSAIIADVGQRSQLRSGPPGGVVLSSAGIRSASRNLRMICSGVCLRRFIVQFVRRPRS